MTSPSPSNSSKSSICLVSSSANSLLHSKSGTANPSLSFHGERQSSFNDARRSDHHCSRRPIVIATGRSRKILQNTNKCVHKLFETLYNHRQLRPNRQAITHIDFPKTHDVFQTSSNCVQRLPTSPHTMHTNFPPQTVDTPPTNILNASSKHPTHGQDARVKTVTHKTTYTKITEKLIKQVAKQLKKIVHRTTRNRLPTHQPRTKHEHANYQPPSDNHNHSRTTHQPRTRNVPAPHHLQITSLPLTKPRTIHVQLTH